MDIDLLSKMVKELILDNDRVVLPGLGSFVAEIVPSTFSDKGYTINPPYRRLYFRSKPDQGDELARFYAKTNNIEQSLAERIISDFISELKPVIHTKKTVVFPGLGRLRATKENNLFFVADADLDIYPEGFGLEPISLKTHQETREEVVAVVEDLKSILADPLSKPQPVPSPEDGNEGTTQQVIPAEDAGEDVPQPVIDSAVNEEVISTGIKEEELSSEVVDDDGASQQLIQDPELHQEEPEQIQDPELHQEEPEQIQDPELHQEESEQSQDPAQNQEEPEFCDEQRQEGAEQNQEEPGQSDAPEQSDEQRSEEQLQPEPQQQPVQPEPHLRPEPQQQPARKGVMLKVAVIAAAVIAVLLVAYAVTGRVAPEFVDQFLYTPEELKILNHIL